MQPEPVPPHFPHLMRWVQARVYQLYPAQMSQLKNPANSQSHHLRLLPGRETFPSNKGATGQDAWSKSQSNSKMKLNLLLLIGYLNWHRETIACICCLIFLLPLHLRCTLGRLWFFVFLFFFFFLIQKGDVIVCSEGPRYFVRTQCCVTVQTILTLVRTLPYKGIQVKSGAFTCFLMAQAY